MTEKELPRWDMTNVYPGLDSAEFKEDRQKLGQMLVGLQRFVEEHHINPSSSLMSEDPKEIGAVCAAFLKDFNTASMLGITMLIYLESLTNTDMFNEESKKAYSDMRSLIVNLDHLENVLFKGWIGMVGAMLPEIIDSHPLTKEHSFYLTEGAQLSKYMMSTEEEKLAGELSLNGSSAWYDLSQEVKSKLTWVVKDEQDQETVMTFGKIDGLREHHEEKMRRRGYEALTESLGSVEHVLAAALNGIKGTQLIEANHRNREDGLHDALDKSRIDRESLNAMWEAVKNTFPALRKFYLIKAKRLGKEAIPFWDVKAPTSKITTQYTYPQAQKFVLENFSTFSDELAGLAKKAFDLNWVDVGPRKGKVGGAYDTALPGVDESRILLNYEENLDWVFTLAHELGHAFHDHCMKGKTIYQRRYPMTLAETASIMCETIVTNAAIQQAKTKDEELGILEASLNSALISIVDMYAAYIFEVEVFDRRAKGKLSAKDFCDLEDWSRAEAYGSALDENYRFQYSWARRPHLFLNELAFYNFPYTFGLLLGTGLYAVYQERGKDFVPQYIEFLSSAGMGTAADLAARFDMDLHSPTFWQGGLDVIVQRIERYASLSE